MKSNGVRFSMRPVGHIEFQRTLSKFSAKDRVLGAKLAMRKRAKVGVGRIKSVSPKSRNPDKKNRWRAERGLSTKFKHGYESTKFTIKAIRGGGGLVGYLGWMRSWAWYLQILAHGFKHNYSGQQVKPNQAVTRVLRHQAKMAVTRFPRDLMMEYHRRLKRRVAAANREVRRKAGKLKRGRPKKI